MKTTQPTTAAKPQPKTTVKIADAPWSELTPEMQQALAEKMLRLREYLGDAEVLKQLKVSPDKKAMVAKLQRGLESKPWYKSLRTHMAFKNGKPVGMVTSRPEKDAKSVYIDNLYVDPNHRNSGIGHSLLQSVINRAKAAGAKQIRLGVDYKNMAARSLYDKLGLKPESMLLKKEI